MIWAEFHLRDGRPALFLLAFVPTVFSVLFFAYVSYSAEKLPDALEPSCEGRVGLVWMDPNRLFPWRQQRVAQETQTVLADVGIDVSWRVYGLEEGKLPRRDDTSALTILLTPIDASTWGLEGNVMGAVVERGENPMVFIFYQNLKRALGYSVEEKVGRSPQDTYRFANALGRVIAHEVAHVCLPEMPHTRDGLMSGRWSLKNLEYKRP